MPPGQCGKVPVVLAAGALVWHSFNGRVWQCSKGRRGENCAHGSIPFRFACLARPFAHGIAWQRIEHRIPMRWFSLTSLAGKYPAKNPPSNHVHMEVGGFLHGFRCRRSKSGGSHRLPRLSTRPCSMRLPQARKVRDFFSARFRCEMAVADVRALRDEEHVNQCLRADRTFPAVFRAARRPTHRSVSERSPDLSSRADAMHDSAACLGRGRRRKGYSMVEIRKRFPDAPGLTCEADGLTTISRPR